MMTLTPLMIDLTDKTVVVVGGGRIAERRVMSLINSGANIRVVSPEITEALYALWEQGAIEWEKKHYESKDTNDAFLVIAATDQPDVNRSVRHSISDNALVNMVDDSKLGNVEFPASHRRGMLTISVSTGGASPMLTSKIIRELASKFDSSFEPYIDFLYTCRKLIKRTALTRDEQQDILKEILTDTFLKEEKQQEMLKKIGGLLDDNNHSSFE